MLEKDLSLSVAKLVEEMRKAGGEPSNDALLRLAAQIGAAFNARKDEVAILRLSPEGMLSFLVPVKFANLGSIPLTSTRSLAAKTIRDQRGEVVNNFSSYKHPTVFETVNPSAEEKATPIQKIVSAPIVIGGKAVGAIQVSRKGKPGDPIGPDFTQSDLAELTVVGIILGKFLATLPAPLQDPATLPKV